MNGFYVMSSSPTIGWWRKGTIIYNQSPDSTNNYVGWICTESGSPGTWKSFSFDA